MKSFIIPRYERPTAGALTDYLTQSVQAFSDVTGIPVTYFNTSNEIVQEFNSSKKICNMFEIYTVTDGPCRRNLSSAGQFASRLGEPYIFMCKSGLATIAIALIIDGNFEGYFLAGPLIMGEIRNSTYNNMCKYNNLTEPTINLVKNYMNGMPHYEPNTVSELALLLYNSIITSVNGISDYTVMKEQSSKENHVNENIQKLKSRNTAIDYPYDKEKELIDYVQEGETEKAAETMVSLLNTFSILEVCDLDSIRNRTLWLFAIILRATGNQENNLNQFLNADTDVIDRLGDASSFDELQKTAVDLIRTITGNMITSVYHGQSQIIMRALQYVNKNYLHKISLKDIERELNVNGSYFSTLFKKEM